MTPTQFIGAVENPPEDLTRRALLSWAHHLLKEAEDTIARHDPDAHILYSINAFRQVLEIPK